jgi:hypothetical protein
MHEEKTRVREKHRRGTAHKVQRRPKANTKRSPQKAQTTTAQNTKSKPSTKSQLKAGQRRRPENPRTPQPQNDNGPQADLATKPERHDTARNITQTRRGINAHEQDIKEARSKAAKRITIHKPRKNRRQNDTQRQNHGVREQQKRRNSRRKTTHKKHGQEDKHIQGERHDKRRPANPAQNARKHRRKEKLPQTTD